MNFTPEDIKKITGNTGYMSQKLAFDNRRPFNLGLHSQKEASPLKMNDAGLKKVVKQLKGAVKAHGNQAKIVQKHIDDMKNSPTKMIGGLKFDAKKGWKKVKAHTTDSGVKGHFVTDPKGKKYFMTSNGKLHTGQIDDLKPESPNKKTFKPHKMYKDGKAINANTYEKHLELKKKGYTHSPNKIKGGVGKGFMNPPYKDTVKGTRPYAKRQGYHGYKDFTSNIAGSVVSGGVMGAKNRVKKNKNK